MAMIIVTKSKERSKEMKECDFCGSKVKTTHPVEARPPATPQKGELCNFCYETLCGVAWQYPEQWPNKSGNILKTIAYSHNKIMNTINQGKEPTND
jgi:hypothetical protein